MKQIDGKDWYKPMEIAELGLIKKPGHGNTVKGNYYFVLKLIRNGQLRAKNYSVAGGRPYWLVPHTEITRYHDTITKVGVK